MTEEKEIMLELEPDLVDILRAEAAKRDMSLEDFTAMILEEVLAEEINAAIEAGQFSPHTIVVDDSDYNETVGTK